MGAALICFILAIVAFALYGFLPLFVDVEDKLARLLLGIGGVLLSLGLLLWLNDVRP